MADNKDVPEKEGSSGAESGRSKPFPRTGSSPARFAGLVMIKNEASSQVPRSKFSRIKQEEHKTRVKNLGKIKDVSSQVPTTGLAIIKPAEQISREENPDKIEVVSSQVPTTGLAIIKPAEQISKEENPDKIEVVSSELPTTGLAMEKPAEPTSRVEIPDKIEMVSSQLPTTGPAMIKHAEQISREKNHDKIEVISSQVPSTGLATKKVAEETSRAENSPLVQNPMNLAASNLEGKAHVSSEKESLVKFPDDMNASSRRDEEIQTRNEPILDGTESVNQGLKNLFDGMLRLSINSPPIIQNPRTPTMNLLAFDFEGVENPPFVPNPITKPINSPASDLEENAHVSSEWESLVELHHGKNASSRQDEDIRTGNEPMLVGMEGVHQGIQNLLDRMQRLRVDNLPFFQNPRTPPINLLASDSEGRVHVPSEMESLFEFCYGSNALGKPDEDIRTGNEPMLGGMEGVYQGIQNLFDRIHTLSSSPFVQNRSTPWSSLLTSDFEGNEHNSFDRDTLFEFYHSMNASSRRDEDINTGNESMLGATGGFYQDTQQLWEQMHRISVNIPSPSEGPNLRYELSPSNIENLGMGLLNVGIYRDSSPENDSNGRIYSIGFSSNRQYRDLSLSEDPLDTRVVDDARQLYSACNEKIQQGENTDLTDSDISEEYLKLYQERTPDNYDFAMNIMAHIELLNDNSWTATVSYFDENVKEMVTSIWNETHTIFENTVKLQGYNREMVLKLMMHFTQCSVNEDFKVEIFLKYCIILCQLGVIARKRIFKEAPVFAICRLRDRIQFLKSENLVQVMLNIVVKDYAKRQHKM